MIITSSSLSETSRGSFGGQLSPATWPWKKIRHLSLKIQASKSQKLGMPKIHTANHSTGKVSMMFFLPHPPKKTLTKQAFVFKLPTQKEEKNNDLDTKHFHLWMDYSCDHSTNQLQQPFPRPRRLGSRISRSNFTFSVGRTPKVGRGKMPHSAGRQMSIAFKTSGSLWIPKNRYPPLKLTNRAWK